MTTLATFLLARIAEDEALANDDRYIWATDWKLGDPARVLAECAAHRRIVERVAANVDDVYSEWTEDILRDLASVYADHPAFKEEWR